ncbi:MAG: hypothetical protein RL701_3004, partial [Pseudomonadota bacterium]
MRAAFQSDPTSQGAEARFPGVLDRVSNAAWHGIKGGDTDQQV